MGFYDKLSRYYDGLFPVDETEMAFIAGRLEGRVSLLDTGCGTGNKTALLAAPGRRISAVDLDAGMIAHAQQSNARPGVSYAVMDMRDIPTAFGPASFDAALCLGNTLVHLDGPAAASAFLTGLRPLLQPGAVLIIQILNYDRILDRKISALPPLESAQAVFSRRYERDGGVLRFVTTLTVKSSGLSFENSVPLYPMRREELSRALGDAGYADLAWFGSYAGDAHKADSFVSIVQCRA